MDETQACLTRCGLRRGRLRRMGVLIAFVTLISGCAAQQTAGQSAGLPDEELADPLEPLNRAIFDLNLFLDRLILRPVSEVYRNILPQEVRESVRSFTRNLRTPIVLINDVLQGEDQRAQTTATRFLINTTIGVGGLVDVAKDMGHPYHAEDFGQTLGVHGAGPGFYLILPILGPSTLRDTVGSVVDIFFDPLTYVGAAYDIEALQIGLRGLSTVDLRSRNIEILDELEREALDFYALIRSVYQQRRDYDIRNERPREGSSTPTRSPALQFP